jgi:hypothetical protein
LIEGQIGVVSEAFAQEMEIVKKGQFKKMTDFNWFAISG